MNSMIIEISVAAVALAFVVLVVFLITTLRSMSALLVQTNTTIHDLQNHVVGVTKEASDVLRHTNAVTVDVLNKLHSLEPTFHSVKQVGEAVDEITTSVKNASVSVARTIKEKVASEAYSPTTSKIAKAINTIPLVLDIWHQIKHRRQEAAVAK
ncbi:DUF948 domain-containing protein [Paenibacillus sp. WQ 127069]|uniref:DUF948 domain-containing protein n=1 Tax=Paenibacillus baimaensis TaxID=2982185 RepID=A0ABT2US79_9BACL|nr:DUF948 domain-containing protein [Paenibacillus sp. WQ 127069]MCU6796926.1 DUF948 domain-containing protein [Paenibacillus sp. WQ 127069]